MPVYLKLSLATKNELYWMSILLLLLLLLLPHVVLLSAAALLSEAAKRDEVVERLRALYADRAAPTRTFASGRVLVVGLSADELTLQREDVADAINLALNRKGIFLCVCRLCIIKFAKPVLRIRFFCVWIYVKDMDVYVDGVFDATQSEATVFDVLEARASAKPSPFKRARFHQFCFVCFCSFVNCLTPAFLAAHQTSS